MRFWFRRGALASKRARSFIKELNADNVRNIAVIRHAALGDMVLTRAFLTELRSAFKNASITLSITSNYTRGVPEDLVDRIHMVHGSDQRGTPFRERVKRFKELGYQDIIFDLAATNRSFMTCFFNQAGLKAGFPYRRIQSRLFYDFTVVRSDLKYEVDDMLSMLNAIGIKTSFPYKFAMSGEILQRSKPYMIYFAGASVREKCWPDANFSQLISKMSSYYPDYDHLVLEGIQPWEKAETILNPITAENTGAVNADTVDETVSLLKGASLVVANDTGIRNLAIVCDTPTVGIFFHTFPFRYWPRCGRHEIAIGSDGRPPEAEAVFDECRKIMASTGP